MNNTPENPPATEASSSPLLATHPVHEHGFVRLVDKMGDDSAIVQAARVSYGDGTKHLTEDRGLIRYLMRHRHTTPFEMVVFKFHVKMPIFVARQWVRHRMASINEYSARYSIVKEEFYVPRPEDVREQSKANKQGGTPMVDTEVADIFADICESVGLDMFDTYKRFINDGVARELARINLPLSTYTEFYWKIDLHNLLHFLDLRMDPHAQQEIRDFTGPINWIVREVCPLAHEAFDDYVRQSHTFSRHEMELIRRMYQTLEDSQMANFNHRLMYMLKDSTLSKREVEEFLGAFK